MVCRGGFLIKQGTQESLRASPSFQPEINRIPVERKQSRGVNLIASCNQKDRLRPVVHPTTHSRPATILPMPDERVS